MCKGYASQVKKAWHSSARALLVCLGDLLRFFYGFHLGSEDRLWEPRVIGSVSPVQNASWLSSMFLCSILGREESPGGLDHHYLNFRLKMKILPLFMSALTFTRSWLIPTHTSPHLVTNSYTWNSSAHLGARRPTLFMFETFYFQPLATTTCAETHSIMRTLTGIAKWFGKRRGKQGVHEFQQLDSAVDLVLIYQNHAVPEWVRERRLSRLE